MRPALPRQVPSGLLPALEIDGMLVTESAEIMSLLEARAAAAGFFGSWTGFPRHGGSVQ